MRSFHRRSAKSWRSKRSDRGLRLEPLEERSLLAIDTQLESGVLRLSADDQGNIVSDNDGTVVLLPVVSEPGSDDKTIIVSAGADTRAIEFAGLDHPALETDQRFVFADGPWVDPRAALAVIGETLGPGWAAKLGIADPRRYLMDGQWRAPMAGGELIGQLTEAGWGNAVGLLEQIVDGIDQRALVYSVTPGPLAEAELGFFNGRIHLPTEAPPEDELVVMPMGGGGEGEDPPPTPQIYIYDQTVIEPTEQTGTAQIVFTVGLQYSNPSGVGFYWQTFDNSATSPGDFTPVSTPTYVNIPSGTTLAYLTVTVNSDSLPEPDETFEVLLGGLTNAQAGDLSGVGSIVDVPTVHLSNIQINEGDANAHVSLTLSRASSESIAVAWNTTDGTARQIAEGYGDYDGLNGNVTFAPNSQSVTLPITIHNDTSPEAYEYFQIRLTDVSDGFFLGEQSAVVEIADDDVAQLFIDDQTKSAEENSPIGTSVGFIDVDDSHNREGASVRYYVAGGGTGNSYFNVNNITGEITVANSSVLDFEGTPTTFTLNITVGSTVAAVTDTAQVTIAVRNQRPSTPALATASDSGSLGDGITNVENLVFVGTAETGDTVELFRDNVLIGTQVVSNGTYSITAPSVIAEGQHFLRTRATNTGQSEDSPSHLVLLVDRTSPAAPPAPTLNPLSNSGSVVDQVTNVHTPIIVGSTEQGATIEVLSDGVVVGTAQSIGGYYQIVVSELAEGARSIRARAIDAAGNVSANSQELSIEIDTQGPSPPAPPTLDPASDSGLLDNVTNIAVPIFVGTAAGAVRVELYDGSTKIGEADVASGSYTVAASRLAEGAHNVKVLAYDAAENASSFSSATTITIVAAPSRPSQPVLASDTGYSDSDRITNNPTPEFTGAAPGNTSVNLYADNVLVGTADVVGGSYSVSVAALSALSAGAHLIAVRGIDAQSTTSPLSPGTIIVVQLSAAVPAAPVLAVESDSGRSNSDEITSAKRPSFFGVVPPQSFVRLFVDGNEVASGFTADGEYNLAPDVDLSNGEHFVEIDFTDVAGNLSNRSNSTSILIDSQVPATPSAAQLDPTREKTVTGTGPAGLVVTIFSADEAVGVGRIDGSGTYQVFLAGLTAGSYTLHAVASDPLTGSESEASAGTPVAIDASLFALSNTSGGINSGSSIALGPVLIGETVTRTFTVTNSGTADLVLYAPILPSGVTLIAPFGSDVLAPTETTTFTIAFDTVEVGSFERQIILGSNDSTNSPFVVKFSWQVVASLIIDNTDPGFGVDGDWLPEPVTDSEAYGGDYRLAPGGNVYSLATWEFNDLPDGNYRVQAHWLGRTDGAESAFFYIAHPLPGNPDNYDIVNVNQTIDSSGIVAEGLEWQELSASVPVTGGQLLIALEFDWNGRLIADAVRIEPIVTPAEVNHAPIFEAIDVVPARIGVPLSFNLPVTDPDNDALQFTLGEGAPSGASINSGVFTWTPDAGDVDGAFNIQVTATDGGTPALSTTTNFVVKVYGANQAPVVMPVADQTVNATHELSFSLQAYDLDGPNESLEFSVDSGPAGLSVTTDGTLTWTPTVGQIGPTNSVTIRVEDGAGAPSTITFNISVGQDQPPLTIPQVTDIELVNDTGAADNVTTDRRIRGLVVNSGGPVSALPVQFDIDSNGIANGSVQSLSDGTFEVNLTDIVHTDGPVTIKLRAGTATPTGIIYGAWSTATFTFESDVQEPTATTSLLSILPTDVGGNHFAGGSLAPSVSVPTQGGLVTFAGNINYGATFGNFTSRFVGLGVGGTNTTATGSTTFTPSTGAGVPDVTSTEATISNVVSVVAGDGSWTLDQTFYYSYYVTSVVLDAAVPVSTIIQWGTHTFVFHAFGTTTAATYSLIESKDDFTSLQRSTHTASTTAGVDYVTDDFVTSTESQSFTLTANGIATFSSGQVTASDEHFVAFAGGSGTFSIDRKHSASHADWQRLGTVSEKDAEQWAYSYDRRNKLSAGAITSNETFDYAIDSDIDSYSADSKYTESWSQQVGDVTTEQDTTRTEGLGGSSSLHYELSGSRTNHADSTWFVVVEDSSTSQRDFTATSSEVDNSTVDDDTPGALTLSKIGFTSATSRHEFSDKDFEGETVTLPTQVSTYSGTFSSTDWTEYTWDGIESDFYESIDTSYPGTTDKFTSDSTSSNSGEGRVDFVVSDGIVVVDASHNRTEARTSTYDETKHGDSAWDNKTTHTSSGTDTSIPDTTSTFSWSHVSTDKGSSYYDTEAHQAFGETLDGQTTASGYADTTYKGSGDSSDKQDETSVTTVDDSNSLIDSTTTTTYALGSLSTSHYDTDGGRSITLYDEGNTEYEFDNILEDGTRDITETESVQSDFEDLSQQNYYKKTSTTITSTDTSNGTFTNDVHDDKTTNLDGTWSSNGKVTYLEGGTATSSLATTSKSTIDDLRDPSYWRFADEASTSNAKRDGTYSVSNDVTTARDKNGVSTSHMEYDEDASGTLTSSASSSTSVDTFDARKSGVIDTAYSDSTFTQSTTGTYTDHHYETADTDATGKFTTTSGNESTESVSGPTSLTRTSGTTSDGDLLNAGVSQKFSRSTSSSDKRTGAVTVTMSQSDHTDAAGLTWSKYSLVNDNKGTTQIATQAQSKSDSLSANKSTASWSNVSESRSGPYQDTSTTLDDRFTDGTSNSSFGTFSSFSGDVDFSLSSGSDTAEASSATVTQSIGGYDTESKVTKTAITQITESEQGNGTFSSTVTHNSAVDKKGVSTNTDSESESRSVQGTMHALIATDNEYLQDDTWKTSGTSDVVLTRDIDSKSDSSKSFDGTFTRTTSSLLNKSNGKTTNSSNSSTQSESGTYHSAEATKQTSTTIDDRNADIPSFVYASADSSYQVPNASYTRNKSDSSKLLLGLIAVSSSSDTLSISGSTASTSSSYSYETNTDTTAPGVTTTNSTTASSDENGNGHVDILDKTVTLQGVSNETTKRDETYSGSIDREVIVHNSSSGVPTNFNVPGTSYSTNTASSSFDQTTTYKGAYDGTLNESSTTLAGIKIASKDKSHRHENLSVDFTEEQESDTHEVGDTSTGTHFDNKQHYDSNTEESSTQDSVEDRTDTLADGKTTSMYSLVTDITGGQGTYKSNFTDDRSETTTKVSGVVDTVKKNSYSKDDLITDFSSHTEHTTDTDAEGDTASTYDDTSTVISSPGGDWAHKQQTIETQKVVLGNDWAEVYSEITEEHSLSSMVTTVTSGIGLDQGTTTTTEAHGDGKKFTLQKKSVGATKIEADTPSEYFTKAYTRTDFSLSTSDYSLNAATTEVADAATKGFVAVQGTLVEDVSDAAGQETTLDSSRELFAIEQTLTSKSTAGHSEGENRTVTTTSSLDPLTHEIDKQTTTSNVVETEEDYFVQSTYDWGTLTNNVFTKKSSTDHRIGTKGLLEYEVRKTENHDTSTNIYPSIDTKIESKTDSTKEWRFEDDKSTNTQTFIQDTTDDSSSTTTTTSGTSTSTNHEDVDREIVQTHSGATTIQTITGETYNHTYTGLTSGSDSYTRDLQASFTAGATTVNSYSLTNAKHDLRDDRGWEGVWLENWTTTGSVGSTQGTVVKHNTGTEGFEGDKQSSVNTTATETVFQAVLDVPGALGTVSSDGYVESLLDAAEALLPGTEGFFQSISSYVSDAIEREINELAADPGRYIASSLLPLDLGGFVYDFNNALIEGIANEIASDFSNLQAAGYNRFTAGVITAFDVAFRPVEWLTLDAFWEGRNREGRDLSALERVGWGAAGAVGTALALYPIARPIQVGLFAGAARVGVGSLAAGAAERELVEAGLSNVARSGMCFPAGTLVATEDGQRPIEEIASGQRVWSCDLTSGEWRLCRVEANFVLDNAEELVAVFVGGHKIESTYHHPYWVVTGQNLEERPSPDHVASAKVPNATVPGRWIDAGDLQVGDVLLLMDGRQLPVEEILARRASDKVYNFAVDLLHNYAVGQDAVLVHNHCAARRSPFQHGELFETVFETSKGEVGILAETVIDGNLLHLEHIVVEPVVTGKLVIGIREVRQAHNVLLQLARDAGFQQLRISGHRTTGANVGKIVDLLFDL